MRAKNRCECEEARGTQWRRPLTTKNRAFQDPSRREFLFWKRKKGEWQADKEMERMDTMECRFWGDGSCEQGVSTAAGKSFACPHCHSLENAQVGVGDSFPLVRPLAPQAVRMSAVTSTGSRPTWTGASHLAGIIGKINPASSFSRKRHQQNSNRNELMLCFSSPRRSSTQCHLHHGRNLKSWTYQTLGSLHHPPCPPSFPSNPMATPKLNLTNKRPFQGPSGMVKQAASWLPKTRVHVCGKKVFGEHNHWVRHPPLQVC